MSTPGIGAMLHYLSGGSEENPEKYYNKIIKSAYLEEDKMFILFTDGVKIAIWDDGQSCCESRYITCDDIPSDLNGQKLMRILAKNGPDIEEEFGDCHEQVFIEVGTDKDAITFCNHNKHNGYYGGFGLTITEYK